MAWNEVTARRTQTSKTWQDSADPTRHVFDMRLKTPLHYPLAGPDSGDYLGNVDMTPVRVNNAELDGWRVVQNGWHHALGQPAGKADGWVGFGGRQGQHWLLHRLLRVGYLHWPTRAWDDVLGTPTYNRANLARLTEEVPVGPNGDVVRAASHTNWDSIWTTLGGGEVSVTWHLDGLHLEEDVYLNQEAREWIAANRPPATSPTDTYFSFVFDLDASDVPQWFRDGVFQDINGDFDDGDRGLELRDADGRVLCRMPVNMAYSDGGGEPVRLRKRLWLEDGHHYLLVGALVSELNSLPAGGITFDPTEDQQPDEAASKDTFVASGLGSVRNHGTGPALETLLSGASNASTLIEFDLSSIDAAATCDSATLYLTSEEVRTGVNNNIYEIAVDNAAWPEGTHDNQDGGADDSCWDYLDQDSGSETAWAGSAGLNTACATNKADTSCDFAPDTIGVIAFPDNSDDTEASCALTAAAVETWFGGANTNYGMVLKLTTEPRDSDWHSSSSATAGFRPQLVVVYTAGNPWYYYAQQQ